MASKNMTAKQKEVIARKLGYDGPMQGFDEFLKSDPALSRKYGLVLDKYMARGGMAKKYALGGDATASEMRDLKGEEQTNLLDIRRGGMSPEMQAYYAQDEKDQAERNKRLQSQTAEAENSPATNTQSQPKYTTIDIANKKFNPENVLTKNVLGAGDMSMPKNRTERDGDATLPDNQSSSQIKFNVDKNATAEEKAAEYNRLREQYSDEQIKSAADAQFGTQSAENWNYLTGLAAGTKTKASGTDTSGGTSATYTGSSASTVQESGQPTSPTAPVITPATITATPEQDVSSAGAPAQAATATGAAMGSTATVEAPTKTAAETIEATTTAGDVGKALEGVKAAKGTVSEEAQVTAAEMEPTSTALSGIEAAQGVAQTVKGAPTRKVEDGEMVSGSAVDMDRVEKELAKTTAAEGKVTKEMTVQGQLDNMLADFDAKNPPPWAAASLRAATAQLAARGLGASSLAGQAIIQSAMESALPIAQQDAAVFQQMEMQNLSNRQQTAVLLAQQRAAFLGQEFDQEFQTRVVNAAKVSDIANMNFNAQTQIALENARLAQTMDLANLNNKQAVVMANAAQIANLEMTNLNNRQQAAVVNAQAFLQMDLQNLSNEQQTTMFKAQSVVQSIFTDAAAENAAKQFNATSKMQVDQFYASLDTQVKQFNASQTNSMEQFRVSQENALSQFNTQQQNLRDQFNAENSRIIAQSNAEWRRQLTLANTQAANEAARINAQNSLAVTQQEYANLWQGYRDDIEMAWKTADNAADRDNQIAMQVISKEATLESAKMQADALKYQALGGATATILAKTGIGDAAIGGVTKLINKITGVDVDSSLYTTFMTEDDPMGLDTDWGAIDAQEGQDYWGGSD